MDTYTRNSRRRAVWILLTVLWMGVIFFFSAQNAEESSNLSGGITDFIAHLIRPDLDRLPETDQQAFLNQLSFFVRKGAHFSEYAVLGLLLTGLAGTFAWNRWIRGLFSWGIGTLYAVSDEFHQTFSDGRSPQLRDVCIDSSGVLFGILAMTAICVIITSICQRNKAKG